MLIDFLLFFLLILEMEIIPEGRHFRLVQESELPEILDYLERFFPESLKVRGVCYKLIDSHNEIKISKMPLPLF